MIEFLQIACLVEMLLCLGFIRLAYRYEKLAWFWEESYRKLIEGLPKTEANQLYMLNVALRTRREINDEQA